MRSSSAPLAPHLHRIFEEKFKLRSSKQWGPLSAAATSFPIRCLREKTRSARRAFPSVLRPKLSARTGRKSPAGQPGQIVLRGPSVMDGYYKSPQETAAVLGPDGWLNTGDLACIDEDGYFFIVGRAKELIIKGGMNIAPRQIDDVLESHPGGLGISGGGGPGSLSR